MSDSDKKKRVIDVSDKVLKSGEARYAKQDENLPPPPKKKSDNK